MLKTKDSKYNSNSKSLKKYNINYRDNSLLYGVLFVCCIVTTIDYYIVKQFLDIIYIIKS